MADWTEPVRIFRLASWKPVLRYGAVDLTMMSYFSTAAIRKPLTSACGSILRLNASTRPTSSVIGKDR